MKVLRELTECSEFKAEFSSSQKEGFYVTVGRMNECLRESEQITRNLRSSSRDRDRRIESILEADSIRAPYSPIATQKVALRIFGVEPRIRNFLFCEDFKMQTSDGSSDPRGE